MKVQCTRKGLSETLSIVGRAVAMRAALPSITCVLMTIAGGDGVHLSATNLEFAIRTRLGCTVEGNLDTVSYAIPYRRLADLVNAMQTNAMVEISDTGKDEILVKWGQAGRLRSRSTIKTTPAEEFPLIPIFPGGTEIEPQAFQRAIDRVIFSTLDQAGAIYGGVLIESKEGKVILASTDRTRISVASFKSPVITGAWGSVVVPSVSLWEMRRVLATSEDKGCQVHIEQKRRFWMQLDGTVMYSGVLDGAFPNYQEIMDSIGKATVVANFSVADFLQIIKAAKIVAQDYNDYLDLSVGPGTVTISCRTLEGSYEASIDAETVGDIAVGINAKFLYEWLNSVGSPQGNLLLTDPGKPARLTYSDSVEESICVFGLMYRRDRENGKPNEPAQETKDE